MTSQTTSSTNASTHSPAGEFSPRVAALWIVAGFALAVGIFLYLYYRRHFYAISADEAGRTILADQWRQCKGLQVHPWLPLPQVLMGLGLELYADLFRLPRLLSGVMGLLTWGATVWLAHELFRHRTVTALSAPLAALFPPRVILASVPLADIYAAAFALGALAALARALNRRQASWLGLAAVFLLFGNAAGYEVWILSVFFLPAAWVGLAAGRAKRGWFVGLALLAVGFPLFWLWAQSRHTGHFLPVTGAQAGDLSLVLALTGFSYWLRQNALTQFLLQNLACMNLLGLAAVPLAWGTTRRSLRWSLGLGAACVAVAAGATLFACLQPCHNAWRLCMPWSLVLVPLSAYFLVVLRERLRPLPGGPAAALATGAILAALFTWQSSERTQNSTFTPGQRSLGESIGQLLSAAGTDASTMVWADASDWGYANIAVASGMPGRFLTEEPAFTGQGAQDHQWFLQRRVRYALVHRPQLAQMFTNQTTLHKVLAQDDWQLFEVSHALEANAATPSPPAASPSPEPVFTPAPPKQADPRAYRPADSPLVFLLPEQIPDQLQKLWDATERNVIYIVHTGWDNSLFDLHLFEELVVPSKGWPQEHYTNNRRLNADLWKWDIKPDGWHFEIEQTHLINYRIQGRIWAQGNCVMGEGEIFNRDSADWDKSNSVGLLCLRTRSAADFIDRDYETVFVFPKGDQAGSRQSIYSLLGTHCDQKNQETWYFSCLLGRQGRPDYEPHILKLNRTGQRRIDFSSDPCTSLAGNRSLAMNCIHANLSLALPKGESRSFSFKITFSQDN